jgi:hypothetical protein
MQAKSCVCKHCGREYKEKFNHDRHIQTCEFLSKTRREQDNEIDSFEKLPSQKEMFLLIQELSMRITKLEKENSELKNTVKRKIKFNDILKQTPNPEFDYNKWIDTLLNEVEKYLDNVYSNDLQHATIDLFNTMLETHGDKLPIRAYDIKQNKFYIYDSDNTWKNITNSDFDKLLARISHRFLVEFNKCWYVVNREKIETEESYKMMYIDYYKKILGGERISDESRYNRIRHHIYGKIKKNIKSMCSSEDCE